MKIASSVDAAHSAVAGVARIAVESRGRQVSIRASKSSSMRNSASISNGLLGDVSQLVAKAKRKAAQVDALAASIEVRDRQDATGMSVQR